MPITARQDTPTTILAEYEGRQYRAVVSLTQPRRVIKLETICQRVQKGRVHMFCRIVPTMIGSKTARTEHLLGEITAFANGADVHV